MKKIRYFSIGLLLLVISSCENEEALPITILNGEYNGVFTVEYNGGQTYTNPVSVTFDGDSYESSIGENRFPAGGNGTFVVKESSIIFSDTNIYTADFDWNLILGGEYNVVTTSSSITLSAEKNGLGVYTYVLNLQ